MIDNNLTSVFFLGIGGIGMSAIARYFSSRGFKVGGYDRTPSPLTKELEQEGIMVVFDESVDALPEQFADKCHTLVVRTPAVPESQQQLVWFRREGFAIKKRAEVLGDITRTMQALCVAGTHGKTTTSTILAHLLYQSEITTNAFLGGISNNYGTNLLLSKESNYVVVEADEYDRSFHQLSPYMAVITSVDPDHLDIYGDAAGFREGFEHFTSLVRKGGALLLKQGLKITPRTPAGVKTYTYSGLKEGNAPTPDFYAENVVVKNGGIYFDFVTPQEKIANMRLGVPVWVNIENSVAAMAIAWLNGVTESELRLGLASYSGVYRRFNIHVNTDRMTYIDDYAHHPTEIKKSIESIRRLFPERHLTVIFQPHLYTRTRDFADGFAKELSAADEVLLLPIYPAREEPIDGVDSEMLRAKISTECRLLSKEELAEEMRRRASASDRPAEVVATVGAGDIDRLVPTLTRILTVV
ncbi:MAG: UDP-N-acetylmuramate--L-alanine ligase [Paludibacteraceae bacterium]|nr:UDP-N-acetylmuramate--L-alanine ligase [Paludibacteraceae bacterium]